MFDIGAGELLVIGVVALIVIGPKELPAVLRQAGKFTSKMRHMAGEFRTQFDEAMREAELDDAKKHIDDAKEQLKTKAESLNPISMVQNHIHSIEASLTTTDNSNDLVSKIKNAEPKKTKRKASTKVNPLIEISTKQKRSTPKKIKQDVS